MKTFLQTYGHPPQAIAHAPGRVNLIGEHTDYSDGFVLPIALEQAATAMISYSSDNLHHLCAPDTGEQYDLPPDAPLEGLSKYVLGCYRVLEEHFHISVPPLNYWVTSTVPTGSGLSSSAALEVSTLRAVRELLNLDLDDVTLARLAQRAENVWAGVPCGIMDQMASSVAGTRTALFLDTFTLEMRQIPLPAGSEIVVINSGVVHENSDGGYAQRRQEVEESARVLEALNADAGHFGVLMNASHASMRDDFQNSTPGVDALVEILQGLAGVYGARMTGGGFGGCVVALVVSGQALEVGRNAVQQHHALGYEGYQVVPPVRRVE